MCRTLSRDMLLQDVRTSGSSIRASAGCLALQKRAQDYAGERPRSLRSSTCLCLCGTSCDICSCTFGATSHLASARSRVAGMSADGSLSAAGTVIPSAQESVDACTPPRVSSPVRDGSMDIAAEVVPGNEDEDDGSLLGLGLPSPSRHVDLAPTTFANLQPDSNRRVQQGFAWFKAFCAATSRNFDEMVTCPEAQTVDDRALAVGGLCVKNFDIFVEWLGDNAGKEVDIPKECTAPHRRRVGHGTLRTVEKWMYNIVKHQLQCKRWTIPGKNTDVLASTLPSWAAAKTALQNADKESKQATYARVPEA